MAIRLACIVDSLGYGGLEGQVVALVNRLSRERFDPVIVCLRQSGECAGYLRLPAPPIFELHRREGHDVGLPVRLGRLLRKTRTQIVHSNNWSTFVEAAAAKLLARVPALVHTQHGLEYGGWSTSSLLKRSLRRAGVAFAVGMNDAIVSVSRAGQKWCRRHWGVPAGKSVLISNGIELPLQPDPQTIARVRRELGLGPGDLVVGSIGTLRPVKNFTGLVRAFSTTVERLPRARLLIVGDGPERGALEELISGLGLGDVARLVGPRSDIPELLAVMDVFALASLSEGMSLAVLEALGAGVPVVATRVGGNPEIVLDGECGILVEPSDETGLSEALVELLGDDDRRRQMGVAGRSSVASSYSLDAMTELYEDLYTRLLRPG